MIFSGSSKVTTSALWQKSIYGWINQSWFFPKWSRWNWSLQVWPDGQHFELSDRDKRTASKCLWAADAQPPGGGGVCPLVPWLYPQQPLRLKSESACVCGWGSLFLSFPHCFFSGLFTCSTFLAHTFFSHPPVYLPHYHSSLISKRDAK